MNKIEKIIIFIVIFFVLLLASFLSGYHTSKVITERRDELLYKQLENRYRQIEDNYSEIEGRLNLTISYNKSIGEQLDTSKEFVDKVREITGSLDARLSESKDIFERIEFAIRAIEDITAEIPEYNIDSF